MQESYCAYQHDAATEEALRPSVRFRCSEEYDRLLLFGFSGITVLRVNAVAAKLLIS